MRLLKKQLWAHLLRWCEIGYSETFSACKYIELYYLLTHCLCFQNSYPNKGFVCSLAWFELFHCIGIHIKAIRIYVESVLGYGLFLIRKDVYLSVQLCTKHEGLQPYNYTSQM